MKTNEEQKEVMDPNLLIQARDIKRNLKQLSKNQLILLVIQQTNAALEQQQLNRFLIEKINKLKKETGEKNEDIKNDKK